MAKKTETKYYKAGHYDVALQTKTAYQRQTAVNENTRKKSKKNTNSAGRVRYYKSIGLGFKTPKTAIVGKYIDKKCPFTGNVSIRGRLMRGVVHSTKSIVGRSIVIRRNYLHFSQKYQRYQKRHKNFTVHCSPCFEPKTGDEVIVGQTRPLSKTIRYNVVKHISKAGAGGKKFNKH